MLGDRVQMADLIGIGAAVTRRPLPHHRAYGSVHGGSSGYATAPRPMKEGRASGSRPSKATHGECASEPDTKDHDRCRPYCSPSADGPLVPAVRLGADVEFSTAARAHSAVCAAPNRLKTAALRASDKSRNSFANPAYSEPVPPSF